MEAFRFLHRDYLSELLHGRVRLVRLRYYQLLEHAYVDSQTGDAEEGRQMTNVNVTLNLSDPRDQSTARLLNISGSNSTVVIENSKAVEDFDCFVLSCSTNASPEQVAEMTQPGSDRDACVRIKGIRCLAQALWTDGLLDDGQRVRDLFHRPLTGRVFYEATRTSLEDRIRASPFRKRATYVRESEVRIAFKPHEILEQDAIFITSAGAVQLLEAFPIDVASVERAEPRRREEAEEVLRRIREEWFDCLQQGDDHAAFRMRCGRDLICAYLDLRRHGLRDVSVDKAIVNEYPTWGLMTTFHEAVDRWRAR
jgi:hypothetical protein